MQRRPRLREQDVEAAVGIDSPPVSHEDVLWLKAIANAR